MHTISNARFFVSTSPRRWACLHRSSARYILALRPPRCRFFSEVFEGILSLSLVSLSLISNSHTHVITNKGSTVWAASRNGVHERGNCVRLSYHLDVETAFLHGDITDTIYLQQPRGFLSKGQEQKVCLLKNAIYGLKQGSRNWNLKLDRALKELYLIQSKYDSCIYSYYNTHKCIIVALFVDDLIVFTDCIDFFRILKEGLGKICPIKDLGLIQRCHPRQPSTRSMCLTKMQWVHCSI